jgi:hypothetical protein
MRKKKVVWRLPYSVDEVPSFGSDEKKRLVDLFKKEKKARRKSKIEESKPLAQCAQGDSEFIDCESHVPSEMNGIENVQAYCSNYWKGRESVVLLFHLDQYAWILCQGMEV